jgi:hypothetical protein
VLPRERAKFLQGSVTPTEWLPIAEKSIHRLLLNSPTYPLDLELVLHSAIVTDFAMERLPDSHSAVPKSRICFKAETVTRTERAFQGKEHEFLTYRSHQRSGSLHRRDEAALGLQGLRSRILETGRRLWSRAISQTSQAEDKTFTPVAAEFHGL